MRIYIDESGSFIPEAAPSRVSCEAALVVPECFAPELLGRFVALRSTWTDEPEIKGSSLSDEQTAAALRLLGEYDVLVEIGSLDVGHNPVEQIEKFRQGQAKAILAGLTPQHNENSRRWANELRDEWLRLSPQLMVQVYVLVLTLEDVIKVVPNYYAQRLPNELGRFDWILDPKDIRPTPFEELWRKAVCPFLQSISIAEPIMQVDGGPFDYSAFSHFDMPIPEYLQPHIGENSRSDGKGLDLAKLFRESVSFPDSRDEPGLQLADIVASAFTKAMNSKLPPEVFRLFGRIMVEKPYRQPTVRLIAFGEGPRIEVGKYHTYVLGAIRNRAKSMFVE